MKKEQPAWQAALFFSGRKFAHTPVFCSFALLENTQPQ